MSYTLLSESHQVACKVHKCIWCGQSISAGEKHRHERSIYDGEFQDQRWHPECDERVSIMIEKVKAIHVYRRLKEIVNGKLIYETSEREVRVMAKAEGYAMVRLKGAMPFVVSITELREFDKQIS